MKKVELYTGIKSSVLGFGCAPIMGARGPKESEKAIRLALELGINHFDLARSYGFGDAEKFVGAMLSKQRDRVVIASKFGILANQKAKILGPLKPLIRVLKNKQRKGKATPASVSTVPMPNAKSPKDPFHDRIPITKQNMLKSLEVSLKNLGTDYLDYFFIHEPLGSLERMDEILETADILKDKGMIRALGLAFLQEQQSLHEKYSDKLDLLQFNNSPGIGNYEDLKEKRGNRPNIFFSPINGGSRSLEPLEKLKILHADFPSSVILCSTFNEKHMKQNVNLFS